MIQASTMSDPFAITYQPLLCVIHVFFFMTSGNSLVQGANERDLNTDKSWIEVLKFMPEGRDFYQKYLKQSKPVAFRGAFQSRIMENATENIERLVQKERFASNGKKMMFSHWYNQSMSEEKELDLRANESLLMDEIALPLMLHCKEYRVVYDHFMLTIIPHITHNYPKQIDNEMMLFSFENRIKIELYDSKYSAELLTNMEIGQTFLEDAVTHATISKGDIIYVPKYWWIKTETLGVPKLAFKIFFNILEGEAQKCATEEQKVDKLQYIKGYKQFLNKQPASIDCSRRSLSLRHVLLINESDPKTLQLRLPKKVEQPHDATLRSGFTMPVLGLGTALLNEKTSGIVKQALDLGYRLIDTAQGYPGSEAGIAQALIESSVPRSEIFIVSKLHPRFLGFDSTLKAIEMSLKSLKVDYIDLFLIHSKECDEFLLQCEQGEPYGTWKESWKAMEYAHRAGKIRSLGVSNFKVFDLIELEKLAQIPVSVVQNWFDPIHQDLRIRKFCSEKNIRYMGYSTLVDAIKRKWKSLRDNFRLELKKVAIGRAGDVRLPMNEYLSKWPYFNMMFFLRDSMMGRKMSSNLPQAILQMEYRGATCSPAPELSTSIDSTIVDQESTVSKELDTRSCCKIVGPTTNATKQRKKLKQDIDENLVAIEKEKLEIEKQKFSFWLKMPIEEKRKKLMLIGIFY